MEGLISVVLCTFNGGEFVEEQLDTILSQTRVPDEVLVFDDGSSDGTQETVRLWSARDPRIQFHQNPKRLGYARNFEQGLLNARGDYIFLSDQDDRWHPERIERMISAVGQNWLLYCDAQILSSSTSGSKSLFASSFRTARFGKRREPREVLRQPGVKGCQMLVSRALVHRAMPAPPLALERWGHDHWLAVHAFASGRADALDRVLMDHRIHDKNISGRISGGLLERLGRKRKDLKSQTIDFWYERYQSLSPLAGDPNTLETYRIGITEQIDFQRDRLEALRRKKLGLWLLLVLKGKYRHYSFGFSSAFGDLLRMREGAQNQTP